MFIIILGAHVLSVSTVVTTLPELQSAQFFSNKLLISQSTSIRGFSDNMNVDDDEETPTI